MSRRTSSSFTDTPSQHQHFRSDRSMSLPLSSWLQFENTVDHFNFDSNCSSTEVTSNKFLSSLSPLRKMDFALCKYRFTNLHGLYFLLPNTSKHLSDWISCSSCAILIPSYGLSSNFVAHRHSEANFYLPMERDSVKNSVSAKDFLLI